VCRDLDNIFHEEWPEWSKELEEILGFSPKLKISYTQSPVMFVILDPKDVYVAQWRVVDLPGLRIVSDSFINSPFRGKGLGKKLCELRVRAFHMLKAEHIAENGCEEPPIMLAYVKISNEPQVKIMKSCGWFQDPAEPRLWRIT
jgi:GNAT superfamily N-acetyltransferase